MPSDERTSVDPERQVVHVNNLPWHFPEEFREELISWQDKCKSPYSHSYYNVRAGEKTWDNTPLNSLRISDHWNFTSHGKVHCPTDKPVPNTSMWTLAQWDGERYVVLKSLYRTKLRAVPAHRIHTASSHQRKTWEKYHKEG